VAARHGNPISKEDSWSSSHVLDRECGREDEVAL